MPRAAAAKRSAPTTDEPQTTTQTTPPETLEAPKCFACGRELTWRDRFYVGATAEQCKACHQRDWHKRLGVVGFHPATTKKAKTKANRSTGRRAGVTAAASGGYAQQRIATWGERQARRLTAKHMRRAQRARVAA